MTKMVVVDGNDDDESVRVFLSFFLLFVSHQGKQGKSKAKSLYAVIFVTCGGGSILEFGTMSSHK